MFAADVWTFLCHKLFQIDHISRAIERSSNRTKTFNKNQRKIDFIFLSFLSFFTIILQDYCYFSCFSFYCYSIDSKKITDTTHTPTQQGRSVGWSVCQKRRNIEPNTDYRLPNRFKTPTQTPKRDSPQFRVSIRLSTTNEHDARYPFQHTHTSTIYTCFLFVFFFLFHLLLLLSLLELIQLTVVK